MFSISRICTPPNLKDIGENFIRYIYEVWGKVMVLLMLDCPWGICIWRNGICILGGWAYPPGSACKVVFEDPLHTWDTTGYGQQAGGTHPTGMHTCSQCFYCTNYLENNKHNKLAGFKSLLKTRNVIRVNKTLFPHNISFRI